MDVTCMALKLKLYAICHFNVVGIGSLCWVDAYAFRAYSKGGAVQQCWYVLLLLQPSMTGGVLSVKLRKWSLHCSRQANAFIYPWTPAVLEGEWVPASMFLVGKNGYKIQSSGLIETKKHALVVGVHGASCIAQVDCFEIHAPHWWEIMQASTFLFAYRNIWKRRNSQNWAKRMMS